MNFKTVTLKERPDLKESLNDLHRIGWAKFMREDTIGVKYWDDLLSLYSEFQFLLLNELEEPIACGNQYHSTGMEAKINYQLGGLMH